MLAQKFLKQNLAISLLFLISLFCSNLKGQDGPLIIEQDEEDNREVYTQLDVAIAEPEKVQVLSLGYTDLKSIPDGIGKMVNVEEIYLNDNKLSSVPASLFSLPKLTILDISGNRQLSNIPATIANLKSLQFIKFGHNEKLNYSEIFAGLGKISTLITVNVMGNKLRVVPDGISNLKQIKELNLADNRLLLVPASIGSLTNLEILDISMNQLTSLPEDIKNLKNLKQINLMGNNLPDAEISKVKGWFPSCKFDL